MTALATKVRTCLWFAEGGLAAARFYTSLLPDSEIEAVLPHGRPDDDPMVVEYRLGGAAFMHLTAGPMFTPSPAASISVLTEDQAETDRLWDALTADGGAESMCGWLTDRFGISWQITPRVRPRLLADPDREAADRAMAAMMTMRRIDIAALRAAHGGEPHGESR